MKWIETKYLGTCLRSTTHSWYNMKYWRNWWHLCLKNVVVKVAVDDVKRWQCQNRKYFFSERGYVTWFFVGMKWLLMMRQGCLLFMKLSTSFSHQPIEEQSIAVIPFWKRRHNYIVWSKCWSATSFKPDTTGWTTNQYNKADQVYQWINLLTVSSHTGDTQH